MAWIESHEEIMLHPKTRKLARLLGLSLPTAIGHLHMLWWWALKFADDGDLSGYDAEDIADAVMWEGDASLFLDALIKAGFVDCGDNGTRLHDWYDYAGKLIERRKADAERKQKERSASKKGASKDREACLQDVQRTSDGHPQDGVRSPSVTITTTTTSKKTSSSGGGNTRAREGYPETTKAADEQANQEHKVRDDDISAVAEEFESCGYGTIHGRVRDELVDMLQTYGREWVIQALREGMRQHRRTLAYVSGILQNWKARGGMTIGHAGGATGGAHSRARADPDRKAAKSAADWLRQQVGSRAPGV